jgi:hypothetical protein
MQMSTASTPPLHALWCLPCSIIDYSKMLYDQQQKAEAADKQRRLQQKLSTPKEMQFSARIAGGWVARRGLTVSLVGMPDCSRRDNFTCGLCKSPPPPCG